MRYIKLFFISVIVFGTIFFLLSVLFPATTFVSRAVNLAGTKKNLSTRLTQLHRIAFQKNGDNASIEENANKENSSSLSDTLLTVTPFAANISQGVAVYEAGNDSSTVQVFYKIHVPFYKPWQKFALMLNETKYGPSLDSAISRISRISRQF